jgi:hypothetical protein
MLDGLEIVEAAGSSETLISPVILYVVRTQRTRVGTLITMKTLKILH